MKHTTFKIFIINDKKLPGSLYIFEENSTQKLVRIGLIITFLLFVLSGVLLNYVVFSRQNWNWNKRILT